MPPAAEVVLRRHRAVTILALALLALLAWAWLIAGAGMGMPAVAGFSWLPHRQEGMAMAMPWDAPRAALTLAMWWVMMVAMMVPAAAPVILLYARSAPQPRTSAFLAGYLLCWLAFSFGAVALQAALESAGAMSSMAMALTSRWWVCGLLVAAGIYQLSPAKDSCLSHCRSPAHWLSRHYRPGAAGALRMGVIHGAYCVGCCWMLMALLFVGGVMNLVWIAGLTILVAAEKMLPHGDWIARVSGAVFLVWAVAIAVRG